MTDEEIERESNHRAALREWRIEQDVYVEAAIKWAKAQARFREAHERAATAGLTPEEMFPR